MKSGIVRGVFAIKASARVPERFFFARRFWSPQVVKAARGQSAEPVTIQVYTQIHASQSLERLKNKNPDKIGVVVMSRQGFEP
jgi:hypothetical protein